MKDIDIIIKFKKKPLVRMSLTPVHIPILTYRLTITMLYSYKYSCIDQENYPINE